MRPRMLPRALVGGEARPGRAILTYRTCTCCAVAGSMAGLLSEHSKGGDAFTGLMLVMPTCLVHMLEARGGGLEGVTGAAKGSSGKALDQAAAERALCMHAWPTAPFRNTA